VCIFSSDSPVLWIRIDPEMTIHRSVEFEQPDFMWQYMLRHERCVVAQYEVGYVVFRLTTDDLLLCLTMVTSTMCIRDFDILLGFAWLNNEQ